MTHDDVLFGDRLRLFTLAEELGSVSEACRQMGVARSTYYVWKRKLERYGLTWSQPSFGPPGGSFARSPPTTARSFARGCSSMRSGAGAVHRRIKAGWPTQTAAPSACS